MQQVDYRYNIRGWLTHINDASLSGPAGQPKDVFGLELSYHNPVDALGTGLAQGQYNGNIAYQQWQSASDGVRRGYAYAYDPMNRLERALYGKRNTATTTVAALAGEGYSLRGMLYGKNGNIKYLERYGMLAGNQEQATAFGLIDKLTYSYANNASTGNQSAGNQLNAVSDAGSRVGLAGDFAEPEGQLGREYVYDESGNLTRDDNKKITVAYNHFNLPVAVRFIGTSNWIEYVYDGAGSKRRKVLHQGIDEKTTHYVSGLVYEGDQLQLVPTPEGRALAPAVTGEAAIAYQYHYSDHLGNLRVAFRKPKAKDYALATMEKSREVEESPRFAGLSDNIRDAGHCNSTAVKLTTQYPLGPMRIVKVSKGDKLSARVWAYYQNSATINDGSAFKLFTQALGNNPPGRPKGASVSPRFR